jgi:hypothetical protein
MLVPILLPERRVGEVDVRGDDPEQLRALDLLAILRLERRQVLGPDAGGEPALVLRHVELAVGLELGDVAELRRRRGPQRVDDLVFRDRDAPAAVLGVQHAVLDQLLPDLVLDLVAILQGERCRRFPLPVVDGLPDELLVAPGIHRMAVDLAGRGGPGQAPPVDAGGHEDEHQKSEDGAGHLRTVAEGLHHGNARSSRPGNKEQEV